MSDNIIKNRYDFIMLFDVADGNPNGDPDAGNLPRIDAETAMGLVTDVCLKRKIRNYVQTVKNSQNPYDIFIKENAILNDKIKDAFNKDVVKKNKNISDKKASAKEWMCSNYYDIRAFGAVMSTGTKEENAGQVRGPIQLTFARSVEPIVYSEHTITRMAATNGKDADKDTGENRTMGRKSTVPYGLYRGFGFISANQAKDTKFSEDDLKLFWDAVKNMFENDRSAARGLMSMRKLIVFKHESELGNAPSHALFEAVSVSRKDDSKPARAYSDFDVSIDKSKIPQGVELIEML